jgi:hypothetical protein
MQAVLPVVIGTVTVSAIGLIGLVVAVDRGEADSEPDSGGLGEDDKKKDGENVSETPTPQAAKATIPQAAKAVQNVQSQQAPAVTDPLLGEIVKKVEIITTAGQTASNVMKSYNALRSLFKDSSEKWYAHAGVAPSLEAVVNTVGAFAIEAGRKGSPYKKLDAGWKTLITLDEAAKTLPSYVDIRKRWIDMLIIKANAMSLTPGNKAGVVGWGDTDEERANLTRQIKATAVPAAPAVTTAAPRRPRVPTATTAVPAAPAVTTAAPRRPRVPTATTVAPMTP